MKIDPSSIARTQGIQRSTSTPDAFAKAIRNASAASQPATTRAAAAGADGDHDHQDGHDGGHHEHEHVTSRLMDHEGRIANLEGQHGGHGDGST